MLAFLALAVAASLDSTPPGLSVRVDSAAKEVVILAGPFDLPDMSGVHDHSASHDTPVLRFRWPLEGWFRGFRMAVLDAEGRPLPRRLLHHVIMINYQRRQLLYPAAERLWGAGIETGHAEIPRTVGVPLGPDMELGMYIAWHNTTGRDLRGVQLRISMLWTPRNLVPRPVDVLPFYADVNLRVGGGNEFDIPPGRSEKAWEFTVPVPGRLLGVTGHLHDYGREVRLEEVESGKVLARVKAVSGPDGRIRKMERKLFGVRGEGLKLRAGRRYRVVAVYDNPTPETLVKGAMGSLAGLFAPSDLAHWPRLEPEDPDFQRDLRFLARRGAGSMRRRPPAPPPAAASTDSAAPGHGAHTHDH